MLLHRSKRKAWIQLAIVGLVVVVWAHDSQACRRRGCGLLARWRARRAARRTCCAADSQTTKQDKSKKVSAPPTDAETSPGDIRRKSVPPASQKTQTKSAPAKVPPQQVAKAVVKQKVVAKKNVAAKVVKPQRVVKKARPLVAKLPADARPPLPAEEPIYALVPDVAEPPAPAPAQATPVTKKPPADRTGTLKVDDLYQGLPKEQPAKPTPDGSGAWLIPRRARLQLVG